MRTYRELCRFETIEDRYRYLALRGQPGDETFGFDRYINQKFYKSREWMSLRQQIILRDEGCDLAVLGYQIYGRLLIHHMNPIGSKDRDWTVHLDPQYLITVSHRTHNAIHYGDESQLPKPPVVRVPGDTKLW